VAVSSLQEEIRSRGYLNFKVLESAPTVCVVRGDGTMIVLESTVQKIIESGPDGAEICFSDSVTAYTGKNTRSGDPLREKKELEFDMVQDGKVVLKIENRATVSLMPIIMQVDRLGVRLPHGEERYNIVSVTKTKTEAASCQHWGERGAGPAPDGLPQAVAPFRHSPLAVPNP